MFVAVSCSPVACQVDIPSDIVIKDTTEIQGNWKDTGAFVETKMGKNMLVLLLQEDQKAKIEARSGPAAWAHIIFEVVLAAERAEEALWAGCVAAKADLGSTPVKKVARKGPPAGTGLPPGVALSSGAAGSSQEVAAAPPRAGEA